MNASPAAAMRRVILLLVAVTIAAFIWQTFEHEGMSPATGTVVAVRHVPGGGGGDSREFTIRYTVDGQAHFLTTRRGILDALWTLSDLGRGDRVDLAVSPHPPYIAVLDTLTGHYGLTLCFLALTCIAVVAAGVVTRRELR